MKAMTHLQQSPTENLMTMTNRKLEAWFAAGGLTVDVVSNCGDANCPDCLTVQPSQEAA